MATLEDIAVEVGCSISTVSRALNHHPRINARTRQRVQEAAERLGYRGNALLRATLREQRTIGFVIPTIRNSHYDVDFSFLHDVLSESGYKIILACHQNDPDRDRSILESLVRHPVSGIIHTPCTPNGSEDLLESPPVPIVELGVREPSASLDVICPDEAAAISELVRHLTGLGHSRVVLLSGRRDLFLIQARSEYFRRAVEREGLDRSVCPVVHGTFNAASTYKQVRPLLETADRPTATIVTNQPALLGLLQAVHDAGLSVPADLSVISFTSEDWHAAVSPPLTVYAHPSGEMGMMAAQVLRQRMDADPDEEWCPRTIRFSGEFIERSSTGPAPAGTPVGQRS